MVIIGCDYHPGFQQIAFLDKETGECGERRLTHREEAEQFYQDLKQRTAAVRVGMESSGHARWFERLLRDLQFELWIGDAAEIRTKRVRKQKTDRQDAQLLLRLMMEDRFPRIWVPDAANRDLRQLLWHRHRLVRMEGWRLGGREKPCPTKKQKNPLDSDRPSHGRPYRTFAPFVRQIGERKAQTCVNGDVTPVIARPDSMRVNILIAMWKTSSGDSAHQDRCTRPFEPRNLYAATAQRPSLRRDRRCCTLYLWWTDVSSRRTGLADHHPEHPPRLRPIRCDPTPAGDRHGFAGGFFAVRNRNWLAGYEELGPLVADCIDWIWTA